MSCNCNNKSHHGCSCGPNRYVDVSKVRPKDWEKASAIVGMDDCGKVFPVNKPEFELSEDDRNKLDSLNLEGKGEQALFDDGEYRPVYTKGETDGIIDQVVSESGESLEEAIKDAVFYDAENNIVPREDVLLDNDKRILGKSGVGGRYHIAGIKDGDQVVGDNSLSFKINSLARPSVNSFNGAAYETNEVAFKKEVDAVEEKAAVLDAGLAGVSSRMDAAESAIDAVTGSVAELKTATEQELVSVNQAVAGLDERVKQNSENIAVNSSDIASIRKEINETEHFRGYYATTDEVLAIANPKAGDYAFNAETSTKWVYNGITWANSNERVPDQTVDAYDGDPLMDGEANPGSSNRYARGDHRHPGDAGKADKTDLDNYMPLAGNTQATRITGDQWMSTGSKVRFTNSGNSYVAQNADSNTTEVVANGVGGIDLVAPNGTVKANGKEIVSYEAGGDILSKENVVLPNRKELQGADANGEVHNLAKVSSSGVANYGSAALPMNFTANSRPTVQLPAQEIQTVAFVEDVNSVENKLNEQSALISGNSGAIAANADAIEAIRKEIGETEHFRGYYATTDEVMLIANPKPGDYVFNAETSTKWAYNGSTWTNTNERVPDQTVEAFDADPLMDGVANAGSSNRYARGDHRHPGDDAKADKTDLEGYMPLSGNSQATRITGDQWMGTGSKVILSHSGNSYVTQNADSNATEVVTNGVGGINLIAPNGPVKANGKEVASFEADGVLKAKADVLLPNHKAISGADGDGMEHNLARVSRLGTVDYGSAALPMNLVAGSRPVVQLPGEPAGHEVAFTDDVKGLEEAVQEKLDAQGTLLSDQASDIVANRSDIDSILSGLAKTEHFKGYYATTAEITSIEEPVKGDFAYSAETGTKWVYNGITWANTESKVPDQTVEAYDSLPLVDGEASEGIVNQYARGDHRHPTDASRASATGLLQANNRIDQLSDDLDDFIDANIEDLSELRTAVNGNTGNISSMMPRLTDAEADIDGLQAEAAKMGEDVEDLGVALNKLGWKVKKNKNDISSLSSEFYHNQNFKGYFLTTLEITQIKSTSGDFAWNAETGTVWVYDGEVLSWTDSLVPIPSDAVFPSDALPLIDGEATAGMSAQYARGDHRHPVDESRASADDLVVTNQKVTEIDGQLGQFMEFTTQELNDMQLAIDDSNADISAILPRLSGAELDIESLQTETGKLGESVEAILPRLSGAESDIESLQTETGKLGESVEDILPRLSGAELDIESLQTETGKLGESVEDILPRLSGAESGIEELQEETDKLGKGMRGMGKKLTEMGVEVSQNTSNIASLASEFLYNKNFKGYFLTTIEITVYPATFGDFAWNAETGTVWVYDEGVPSWTDSLLPIPSDAVPASNAAPLMDGEAQVGVSTDYARGDHRHPSDESKADKTEIPVNVSELANDAGYVTSAELDVDLEAYALKTDIPEIPENVSVFTNDSGYVTSAELDVDLEAYALKTDIPEIPENVSVFTNDAGYVTSAELDVDLEAYALKTDLPEIPENVSVFTNDAGYITSEALNEDFALKTDIPEIPENVSAFTNDAGYVTAVRMGIELIPYALKTDIPEIPENVSVFTNDAGYVTSVELDTDLEAYALKTDIPEIPENVSTFTNDAGYVTSVELGTDLEVYALKTDIPEIPENVSTFTNDAGYVTSVELGTDLEAYALKTDIPEIPENVSAFTNDAGYLTSETLGGDLSDYALKTDIPVIPGNVSAFTNDAEYITMESVEETLDNIETAILSVGTAVSQAQNNITELQDKLPYKLRVVTEGEFDAISVKDEITLYFIKE